MLKDHSRKTSRAAILPFPGDPFLFAFWFGMFKKYWGKDVDKLYVYMNSPIGEKVAEYCRGVIAGDPRVVFHYEPMQVEHGEVLNRLLDMVQEKYVMLIEDDCYIWTEGIISQCFNQIECGARDIVGSKRTSCGMEILSAAKSKWGLSYEGEGDQGPNFWPNLFFCEKTLLTEHTNRNFGAKAFPAGKPIEWLDGYVPKEDQFGDTFVEASLQLRCTVPEERIGYVAQYHGHPLDLDHYDAHKYLFDGHAPWCHIGSLSSGIGGLIRDDDNRPLSRALIDPPAGPTVLPNGPTNEFEVMEYERRVQWWEQFYWSAPQIGLANLKMQYQRGLDRIVQQFRLSPKRIRRRRQIYSQLMNGEIKPL